MVRPAGAPAVTVTETRGLSPVKTVLPEGAIVIVQETATTPAVTISASFLAGGLYEPQDLLGLAFLTGRVLDRGTEQRSVEELADSLDERGVSLRVATTRHTMTLSCTCLQEDFDEMLAVIVDVVRRPTFPEPEVEKKRAETVTLLRQDEDNPAVRAVESLFELLYGPTHPYGRRAKGTVETVERISRADMAAFHNARMRPASLSLVIVGDVSQVRALDRAAAELDGWTGGAPAPVGVPPPFVAPSRRHRLIHMPGKSQADIAYGVTTIRRVDPRYYAYWMMNNVLGQFGLGGRLADNIRERQGMAYYTFSAFDPNVGEGPLVVRAGVDPANVDRALAAIDHEVATLAAAGPTPRELAETRDYLIGSIPRLLETNQSIAAFLQASEQFGLGLDYDRRLADLLRAVTLEDVRAAAAEALRPERAAVAIASPHES